VIRELIHVMRGRLDVLSKSVEDGRWLGPTVSEIVEDVCEQVDVVRRSKADVEKTNQGTEGRAPGLFGLVDVVFPLARDSRRLREVSRARARR
jgi:hypothetical protein